MKMHIIVLLSLFMMKLLSGVTYRGEINLLYTTTSDCESSLKGLALSGDCIATSNCTFSSIQILVQQDAVCGLTSYGTMNSISAKSFDNIGFYFDSDTHANASATRAFTNCATIKFNAGDTFDVFKMSNCDSKIALPEITGLINVSMED